MAALIVLVGVVGVSLAVLRGRDSGTGHAAGSASRLLPGPAAPAPPLPDPAVPAPPLPGAAVPAPRPGPAPAEPDNPHSATPNGTGPDKTGPGEASPDEALPAPLTPAPDDGRGVNSQPISPRRTHAVPTRLRRGRPASGEPSQSSADSADGVDSEDETDDEDDGAPPPRVEEHRKRPPSKDLLDMFTAVGSAGELVGLG
jgi:hypothetical protein